MRAGRRVLVFVALTVALSTPFAACGRDGSESDQPEPARRATIGILRAVVAPDPVPNRTFLKELGVAGYQSGKGLTVLGADPNEVHPDPAEAQRLATEWASQGADVIVALSSTGAKAAAAGAPSTPILFLSNDPTAVGLIKDERHPEGNLTGATFRVPADRTLDAVRRVFPGVKHVGVLFPSNDASAAPGRDQMIHAAAALGIELTTAGFGSDAEVPPAVSTLRTAGVEVLALANAPTTVRSFPAIKAATQEANLPVVANTTADFAVAVLEPDVNELYRQMARQLVRLLSGSKPADVPVEDPGRFRFVVNLAVAANHGVQIEQRVIDTADQVIR